MAQTGYTPIYLYYSGTATHIPLAANLGNGELAINAADGNLFYKNTSNAVVTIPVLQSSSTQSGWLSSTDWNTFNSKAPAGSYLTAVTADSPLTGAGTSASHLSIPAASGSTNGYLTRTDWTTFNSKQAALVSGTNIKTVSGTTLLGSGDLGTIGVGYGGTGTSTAFTAGSVVYAGASGVYSQDNANFFWDSTNHYLGIGTTSPHCKLELYNTIYLPASGEATGVGSLRITNNQNVLSAAGGIEFKGTGNGSGSGSKIQNLNGQGLTFAVRSNSATWTNAMQIAEGSGGVSIGNTTDPGAANLSVSGNVVIATSGKGIDFSATAGTGTSELLADYEEGTFTPSLSRGAGFSYTAGTSDYGYYTKIGRVVYITCIINGTFSGGSGLYSITGLPYTSAAYVGYSIYTGVGVDQSTGSGAPGLLILVGASSTSATLFGSPVSGNVTTFTTFYHV